MRITSPFVLKEVNSHCFTNWNYLFPKFTSPLLAVLTLLGNVLNIDVFILLYLYLCSRITFTVSIYNMHTMSENIKFICTSFRNRQKIEPLTSFSSLFRSECKLFLYLTTMYVYCVYPGISKSPKHMPNCLKIA